MIKEIKGWHVLSGFVFAFGIIIAVNFTLAFNAVKTFPGLEVKNSYVASQSFDSDRAAQTALSWDVSATVQNQTLRLEFQRGGSAVQPEIEQAVFGRATNVSQDQNPEFSYDGNAFVAAVAADGGNWNLRLKARAADGTLFQQRVIVKVIK